MRSRVSLYIFRSDNISMYKATGIDNYRIGRDTDPQALEAPILR